MGFKVNSPMEFQMILEQENAKIEPDILTKPIPKEGIEMYKYFRNLILNVSGKEAND